MEESDIKKIKDLKNKTLHSIYVVAVYPSHLPKDLYEVTADVLTKAVVKGYKVSVNFDAVDEEFMNEVHENIYFFSGAKTFQQTAEMSEKLFNEDGELRTFAEFKDEAGQIFDEYNVNWLKSEYNTALETARAAEKWNNIESNKESRPYVQYKATEDERMCEICGAVDGIIAPVDDPVWNGDGCVPQHFNCKCVLMSLDDYDAKQDGGAWSRERIDEAVNNQVGKNPLFSFNPAKSKVIFQDTGKNKHPYFEVSRRYRELAKKNFNLPIPKRKTT